jgi:energy-coupling factor transporter transmembrane protein EcfT
MVETQFTLIAEVGDTLEIAGIQLFRVAINLVPVQPSEQIVKGGTQVVASATTVTNVEDMLELAFEIRAIPKFLAFSIETHNSMRTRGMEKFAETKLHWLTFDFG